MPSDSPVSDQRSAPPRQIDDEWIREHYSRIHRAAWLMTGDAWSAEDLAQETFIVALDQWQKFEGRSSETTWLYGILLRLDKRRRRTLGRMRRRWKQYIERGEHLELGATNELDPQTQLAQQQWRDSIWAEVAELPNAQREAVTLKFAEEMNYQQIAETLGCAVGTAKTRVHHGLKRLKIQHPELQPMQANPPRHEPSAGRQNEIQLSTRS